MAKEDKKKRVYLKRRTDVCAVVGERFMGKYTTCASLKELRKKILDLQLPNFIAIRHAETVDRKEHLHIIYSLLYPHKKLAEFVNQLNRTGAFIDEKPAQTSLRQWLSNDVLFKLDSSLTAEIACHLVNRDYTIGGVAERYADSKSELFREMHRIYNGDGTRHMSSECCIAPYLDARKIDSLDVHAAIRTISIKAESLNPLDRLNVADKPKNEHLRVLKDLVTQRRPQTLEEFKTNLTFDEKSVIIVAMGPTWEQMAREVIQSSLQLELDKFNRLDYFEKAFVTHTEYAFLRDHQFFPQQLAFVEV